MRFKDLIGKKSEPEVPSDRGATTPAPRDAPVPRTDPVAPSTASAPVIPVAAGSLADLFSRLLAAEQGEPAPPPATVSTRLNEADVERIAVRVAERFEGALRDEVRRIVAEVTERLIREEIARIRRAAESDQA